MASSSSASSFKYDVFLSFRGKDIRKTFVDHLYESLKRQGIHTYKDDEEIEQGKRIDSELLKSIEDSRFYIIVFSKKYASSSWCLDELVKIMECRKTTGHSAYPVFYDVEPTNVRHQRGAIGKAFAKHKNKQDAGKWAEALKEAADLAGWELKTTENGHEAKFIKKIVTKILLKLHSTKSHTNEKLIGMEPRIKLVLSSLEATISNDARMIGIKGIGGGGKTTLAKAIFDEVSIRFEGKSFVENVREVSKASSLGLKSLQNQVLSDVFNDPTISVNNLGDGKQEIKDRLCGMNVIIVLDDVDHIDQLEALAGARNWFKRGSVIIITTRNVNVLKAHGLDDHEIHDVDLLEDDEAMSLFNRYAFPKGVPSQGYGTLSKKCLRYAAGLPLTIRALGIALTGKVKHEWKDALERLKKIPLEKTQEILELSYIGLDIECKEIFLDVACFLKLSHKADAIKILECRGFSAKYGLKELEQKSLITVTNDQRLGMHDQIQEMGWHIVRRVQLDDPRQHSRLWIRKEIETILANDSGTIATSAITVEDFLIKLNSMVVTKGFGELKKLRLLRVESEIEDPYGWDEMADQVEQNFPHTLQYLGWRFYPHSYLPRKFVANDLVALEMSDCKILRLWEGEEIKVLDKLRFLDLKRSKLTSLNLGLTPKLEKLDLEGCDQLVELQMPIECLKKLVYLNLSDCLKVHSFSFIKRLGSLEVLCLNNLFLKEFPDIIPEHCNCRLRELQFKFTTIEELPSSIANFQKLESLDLHSCRNLKSIPKKLCGLQQLKTLDLYGCILEELPEDIEHLQCLEKLNLSSARIRYLPKGICKMKHLETLNLSSCFYLKKLPSDLGRLECLEDLILTECEQVKDIPDSICKLERLKYFSLLNCVRVDKLPQELGQLKNLEVLNVKGTRIRHFPPSIHLLKSLKIHENKSVLQSRGYACTSGTIKTSYKKRKIGH